MKYLILNLLLAILLISCVRRDDGMGSRSNPYDAGGDAWSINANPEFTAIGDSGWVDFNYTDSIGTVLLCFSATDRNFPHDTLSYTIIVGSATGELYKTITADTLVPLPGLKAGGVYTCTVIAADKNDGTGYRALTFTTPLFAPPQRPFPGIVSGGTDISLSWKCVPGADEYRVYTADSINGPFILTFRKEQKPSGTVTVIDSIQSYRARYYLVAASNGYGESFARDTLFGRRFYGAMMVPYISSVSQGSYSSHIRVSLDRFGSTGITNFELYRSVGDTFSFRMIADLPNSSQSDSYLYYHDTVGTTSTCYYRALSVDAQNRSSKMSGIRSGYIQRLDAPVIFSDSTNFLYIPLAWSAVPGAHHYKIYRSTHACTDTITLFDSTTATEYSDTVFTSGNYYYTVSSVDTSGNEGGRSQCVARNIVILPKPENFEATNGRFLNHIDLIWSAVPGASGYVIYRKAYHADNWEPIDSVTALSYSDTVNETRYYYRAAAYNERGIGSVSSGWLGTTIMAPVPETSSSSKDVYIKWTPVDGAGMYYLYRSLDSTDFICIDSIAGFSCYDIPPDYRMYYYRLAIRIEAGVSIPGDIVSGALYLIAPEGLHAQDMASGCLLSWNAIPGADYYSLSREQDVANQRTYKLVTDTFYFDTITTGARYYYRIGTRIDTRYSQYSWYVIGGAISTPLTPTDVSADGTATEIMITWSMPANSSPQDGFIIHRSSTSFTGPFTTIDTTTAMSYTDGMGDTLLYYYCITAYNSQGESACSETAVGYER
ncbi:MAG: hypothetical protein JW863_14035 [Chitinispirillaceae bacterium]|nr:hypothetical protein [Chitinispirillaceae bacterium]